MGIADRLRQLTKQAKDTAAEHKDEIQQAVEKAETIADQRTGGKYHDQIQKAGTKVETYVEALPTQPGERQTAEQAEPQPPRPGAKADDADQGPQPG
jgi:ABC-type transporter Mla subunit MlaD